VYVLGGGGYCACIYEGEDFYVLCAWMYEGGRGGMYVCMYLRGICMYVLGGMGMCVCACMCEGKDVYIFEFVCAYDLILSNLYFCYP
jgi:hypothetical protein